MAFLGHRTPWMGWSEATELFGSLNGRHRGLRTCKTWPNYCWVCGFGKNFGFSPFHRLSWMFQWMETTLWWCDLGNGLLGQLWWLPLHVVAHEYVRPVLGSIKTHSGSPFKALQTSNRTFGSHVKGGQTQWRSSELLPTAIVISKSVDETWPN